MPLICRPPWLASVPGPGGSGGSTHGRTPLLSCGYAGRASDGGQAGRLGSGLGAAAHADVSLRAAPWARAVNLATAVVRRARPRRVLVGILVDAVAVEDGVDDVDGELGRVVVAAIEVDAVAAIGAGPGALSQRGGRHGGVRDPEPRRPDSDA